MRLDRRRFVQVATAVAIAPGAAISQAQVAAPLADPLPWAAADADPWADIAELVATIRRDALIDPNVVYMGRRAFEACGGDLAELDVREFKP